jgi:sugar/nucleoside kinase (ribokinase family)
MAKSKKLKLNKPNILKKRFDIVSIGRATEDIILSGEIFRPVCISGICHEKITVGMKHEVEAVDRFYAGNAFNASVTFSRQNLKTAILIQASRDLSSEELLDILDSEKISSKLVFQDSKYKSATSIILLPPSGDRTVLTYRGSKIDHQSLINKFSKVSTEWVYISSTNSIELLKGIFTLAAKKGVLIAFYPGGEELREIKQVRKLLTQVEVLILNKEEAALFFGDLDAPSLARAGSEYSKICVVTDGPHGSFACSAGKDYFQPISKDVKVIDRNGAGDAFSSGLVSVLAHGGSLKNALQFGSENSTSVVQQVGSQIGILRA